MTETPRITDLDGRNPYPGLEQSGEQQAVPQSSMLEILWHQRWVVLISVVVVVLATLIYLLRATPIFTSNSVLFVEQEGPQVMRDVMGGKTSDSYIYTQAEILKSTSILSKAADAINPKAMRTFSEVDNPVAYLKKNIDVEVGKKDSLITISFDSPYPVEAAQVVNAIVQSYVNQYSSQNRSTAAEMLRILQKEKDQRDTELTAKIKELADFRQANGMLLFETDRTNLIVERLALLSDTFTKAQVDTIIAKSELDTATEMAKNLESNPSAIQVFLNSRSDSFLVYDKELHLTDQINQTELEAQKLKQEYTPEHPSVKAITLSLEKLNTKLKEQQKNAMQLYLETAKQRYATTLQQQKETEKLYSTQEKLAMDLNSKSGQLTLLDADIKRLQNLVDLIDTRIKEVNINEDSGAMNINIVEVARPEEKPTKPQKARVMGVGLALGLMLGIGLAFLRDWTDQRMRSPEEIQAVLSIQAMGVVPHMQGKLSPAMRGQTVSLEPNSDVAEAYRTIRTALYFGVSSGKSKTILVTSPSPGDGKTTSASNLALAIAQAGQKVLLLDADFRKPSQHKLFEIKGDTGFANVLAGKVTLESVIHHTKTKNLDLLPCGPIPENPSEILNSPIFSENLKTLSSQYDHIVIDSPPVIPVTDARILGALCDTTILVLRADKSTRKLSEHARDALLGVGATILGIIVNDVPKGRGRYGYYSGYGYYRYGGYGERKNHSNGQAVHTPEKVS